MSSADVRNHIDCTLGKVFLDGVECIDAVSLTFTFSPITSSTKTLGHTGQDTRWKGYNGTATLTEYRSRDWLKKAIQNFINNGTTPVMTIQGIVTDENSDYYKDYGGQTITATGCVPTGDITLMTLDADSDFATDAITFSVKNFAYS